MSTIDNLKYEFDPVGYGGRLYDEIDKSGLTVSRLRKMLVERVGDALGVSYGTLQKSTAGRAAVPPRKEVLDGMAAILGVRGSWLVYEVGERTEDEERLRLAKERAAADKSFGFRGFMRAVQEEFQDNSTRLEDDQVIQIVLIDTMLRLLKSGLVPKWRRSQDPSDKTPLAIGAFLAAYNSGDDEIDSRLTPPWVTVPKSIPDDVSVHYAGAAFIGRMLNAPFAYLPVTPADLSDTELRDHVIQTCQALSGLAGAAEWGSRDAAT